MQGLVQGMLGAKKDVDSILVSRLADGWMGGWMDGYPGFPISIGVRRIQDGHMMMPLRDHQVAMFFVYIVFSTILC